MAKTSHGVMLYEKAGRPLPIQAPLLANSAPLHESQSAQGDDYYCCSYCLSYAGCVLWFMVGYAGTAHRDVIVSGSLLRVVVLLEYAYFCVEVAGAVRV